MHICICLRQNLIVESAQSKAQLKEIEDRILELLSNAKGNILDDEELINTLATSKVASQRIEERVQEQEKTQAHGLNAAQQVSCLIPVSRMHRLALFCLLSRSSGIGLQHPPFAATHLSPPRPWSRRRARPTCRWR